MNKGCVACGESKPLSDFYSKGSTLTAKCRPCQRAYNNNRRKEKPDAQRAANARRRASGAQGLYLREYNLQKKYGIGQDEYRAMLEQQGGTCYICKAPPTEKRRLAVDHCHGSGGIRKLLCHTCNNHLGIFERKKADFEAYLKEHE